jgi:UDP-hydrolysing UDP-N-acetyl-D-glucosamine 2-epimerase
VAASTLPFNIPVAHIHGGETTEGAVDEVIRHAISKISHLHFVAAVPFADRLRQMGEESWRVVVSGAPALDVLAGFRPTSISLLERRLGVPMNRRTLLVTFHPETRGPSETMGHVEVLLQALQDIDAPIVFTAPNSDPANRSIARRLVQFAAGRSNRVFVANLGQQDYFSAMYYAGAMVGNSSSGIIEAPSFKLPVVNIGDRQRGRLRARNVVDVPAVTSASIKHAIRTALSGRFRRSLNGLKNPYGRRHAGRTIARRLAVVPLNQRLLVKMFVDVDGCRV